VAAEGERPRSDDHGRAAGKLRDFCSAKQIPDGGLKHFEWLLDKKTRFSYDERYVDVRDLQTAKVKMDQFFEDLAPRSSHAPRHTANRVQTEARAERTLEDSSWVRLRGIRRY